MQKLIDPTLQMAALAALERVLNQALRLDPATRQRLASLAGQVFHLHCTRPDLQLFVMPQRDGVQLAAFFDGKITAGLTGEARDFSRLLHSDDPAAELINGNLVVRGDSKALQQLQRIASDLDIDWEAPLARVFGDVIGYQLGQGLRHLASRALYAGKQVSRQLQDFVAHESHLFAAPQDVQRFGRDVDQLARRGEQLEQQLNALRQRFSRR
jgi:ubiquinone biosynthesis protein UbiJ